MAIRQPNETQYNGARRNMQIVLSNSLDLNSVNRKGKPEPA